MKVISFCLWGDNPKYCVGAIKNAQLARELYPDWDCYFYISKSVPRDVVLQLLSTDAPVPQDYNDNPRIDLLSNGNATAIANGNIGIITMPTDDGWSNMFWRFEPISFPECEVMISRDCDSRLSLREKHAVDEWLASDKSFHTMHCHWHHSVPILGGLFGIKKGLFSEMSRHALEWARTHESRWQVDQDFLKEVVWPVVQHDTLNHADFHTNIWPGVGFPTPIEKGMFIGASYDENDKIDPVQLRQLYG